MRGVLRKMLERQCGPGKIVEDRFKFPVEQRKPMLHARVAPALAHRFVKQVIRSCSAEFRNVTGSEAADGFGDKLQFRYRHQVESAQFLLAALCLGIECADRLEGIAE